ncbi:uncharacterized protein LOC104895373 [Beta vulgaris subsp. vulgaris]|uniref:uncharacterized protein LOC104895373 n=1 Tax=Beta vulgaris subsp. vulgaris TaxID=3555 RepID=UPI00203767C7|nr:uncharacterized protein LOC104895373 [Beta vulgaris subsp. vulgaris]
MGNRRRNGRKKVTQVIVCCICGDRGFLNALIDCSQCSSMAAHQYCLGIPPGSIIAHTKTWSCDYCFAPTESKSCKTQIIVVKDEPQPLQTLPPISYDRSSEQTKPGNEPDNAERT